ncbi:hypothetical protein [Nocardia fluminea]|uniref:hypothetical protein n=1 Tax=Nocardia fluminea TaxID=134984 RepID=UPI0033D48014
MFYTVGCEDLSKPIIEGFDEEVFFEKDIGGVFEMIGDGIFTGVAAAVERRAVEPVALHLAPATLVSDESLECIRVGPAGHRSG